MGGNFNCPGFHLVYHLVYEMVALAVGIFYGLFIGKVDICLEIGRVLGLAELGKYFL